MYCAYDRSDRDTVEHCYHSISTMGLVSVEKEDWLRSYAVLRVVSLRLIIIFDVLNIGLIIRINGRRMINWYMSIVFYEGDLYELYGMNSDIRLIY